MVSIYLMFWLATTTTSAWSVARHAIKRTTTRDNLSFIVTKSIHCDISKVQEDHYPQNGKDRWQDYIWDQPHLFDSLNRLLDRIFSSTTTTAAASPLLRRLDDDFLDNLPSDCDHFYAPLFQATKNSKIDRMGETMSTSTLSPINERKQKTRNYRLQIRYRGNVFCGWQRQKDSSLPAVQQVLEDWLQALQTSKTLQPVHVRVSGRTDAGVHALSQICRFRTKENISEERIQNHLNQSPWSSSLQCTSVTTVSSKFHPTFGATCRAYAYVLDWNDKNDNIGCSSATIVQRLNVLLRPLQNRELDYYSMSYGPVTTQTTNCTISLARVCLVELVDDDFNYNNTDETSTSHSQMPRPQQQTVAIMFQLVADRFLRRMVRILVATALQHALDDSLWDDDDATVVVMESSLLLDILRHQNRRASAKPAPAHGLLLMGADVFAS